MPGAGSPEASLLPRPAKLVALHARAFAAHASTRQPLPPTPMQSTQKKLFAALAAASLLATSAFAQDAAPPRPGDVPASSAAAAVTAASAPAAATPLAHLPYTPSLDVG